MSIVSFHGLLLVLVETGFESKRTSMIILIYLTHLVFLKTQSDDVD